MKKCVVYTAITKGYDALKLPTVKPSAEMDFVCFTDDPCLKSELWKIQRIETPLFDPTRQARYLKTHPHTLFPDHRNSIWVDGSLSICGDLNLLLEEVLSNGLLGVYSHAKRACIYSAAANCIDKKKDNSAIIEAQMRSYKKEGYPIHHGLVASGVLVRRHHQKKVVNLMDDWWHEISHFSKRDQLSFNYVCWKKGFEYYAIPERIGDGRFFRRNPHL